MKGHWCNVRRRLRPRDWSGTRSRRRCASSRAWRRCRCRSRRCGRSGRGRGTWWWASLRAVSPAGVRSVPVNINSPPHDHFAAGPGGCVRESSIGRDSGAGSCPSVGAGVISAAGVKGAEVVSSAPDDHFTASPDCSVPVSGGGRVGNAGGCPTIRAGIVSPTGVQKVGAVISSPDNHFIIRPDRFVF